jgi:hypothetical protein
MAAAVLHFVAHVIHRRSHKETSMPAAPYSPSRRFALRLTVLVLLSLWTASSATASGDDYFTLTPCRIHDTRTPVADPLHGGPDGRRDIQVSGVCGVPSEATVVAVNLTGLNASRSGGLIVYDADLSSAPESTLQLVAGRSRANNALVGLSAEGKIAAELAADFAPGDTADLVVDVLGYFVEDSLPPTAVDDTATVAQNSVDNPIDVLANDTDPDGGPKRITALDMTETLGAATITGGGTGISYTPPPNQCTSLDSFSYTITGGSTARVGVAVPCTSIRIVKTTNGVDANLPPGPSIPQGSTVQWRYLVTNIGAEVLSSVKVTDSQGVAVACPKTTLAPGESMNCSGNGVAQACQYRNIEFAAAKTPAGATVVASDPSHYFGTPCP